MISGIGAGAPLVSVNGSRNVLDVGRLNLPENVTRPRSNLSDSEFEERVEDLVRKYLDAGIPFEHVWSSRTPEWFRLRDEFISVASPDRMGIITGKLNSLAFAFPGLNRFSLTFLDALMQNQRSFVGYDVGSNMINFRDGSGNIVAMFTSDRGWLTDFHTEAEVMRIRGFEEMWREVSGRVEGERLQAQQVSAERGGEPDLAAWIRQA